MFQTTLNYWSKDYTDIFDWIPLDWGSGWPSGGSNLVYFDAIPIFYTFGNDNPQFHWVPITFDKEGIRCN